MYDLSATANEVSLDLNENGKQVNGRAPAMIPSSVECAVIACTIWTYAELPVLSSESLFRAAQLHVIRNQFAINKTSINSGINSE